MPARLLVIDQDARYGEWLRHHLGVICPESPVGLMPLSDFSRWSDELSGRDCDVLMLAASFGASPEDPQAQGLELLRRLREKEHFPPVIVVAEEGNELTAVRALQLGAVDYLPKRLLTPERLKTAVKLALRMIEKRVARRIASLSLSAQQRAGKPERPGDQAGSHDLAYASEADSRATSTDVRSSSVDVRCSTGADGRGSPGPGTTSGESSTNIRPLTVGAAGVASLAGSPSSSASPPGGAGSLGESSTNIRPPTGPRQVTGSGAPVPAARAPGGEFMPANFIPGYTIHATIGESEKAAVYVATNDVRGENVALKVSKTLRDEAAGRQFLEREYRAIVAIRDPAVVQIHDYGVHSGYEYLVMEYLPRGDLKARMQQSLTEQEAVRYVAQIAAALRVVHRAGLLHRDLKPPNVMLRENGAVALIDFGLARALDGSTPSTRTGVLRGSPYYMSPEQALGELLDERSDFYSLGIMFYEMLTGKKPYTGGSAMDVLQQHVNAPVPMLPKALAHHEPVLLKLMAKSRDDRFASAQEILAALGPQTQAPPTNPAHDSIPAESSAA